MNKLIFNFNTSNISSLILVFSITFLFLIQSLYGFVFIAFVLFCYSILFGNFKIERNDLCFVSAFTFLVIPTLIFLQHGFSHYFYYLLTLLCYFSAKSFSKLNLVDIFKAIRVLFWFYVLFSFFVYYKYRDLAEPFSGLIEGSSTNGIPSYLIVIQAVYSILYYCINRRLPIVSSFFTLAVALIGIGRGSIYISVLIVIISVLFNFYFDFLARRFLKVVFPLFFLLGGVFFILINIDWVYHFLSARTKALQGINDPYRNRILIEYILKLEWWQVFVGGSFNNTVISSLYNGNPHIAYVRSHAYLGFFYFVFIIFSPFLFLIRMKCYRKFFVFLVFSVIILFRALSEPILFPTALDFFYILIFFIYFKSNDLRFEKMICKQDGY